MAHMTRTHSGTARRLAFCAAMAAGMSCGAADYRYPSELPVKSLKMEVREEVPATVGAERHMRWLRTAEQDRQLKDTRPLTAVTLHVCRPDGSDLAVEAGVAQSTRYVGGGWNLKATTNVVFTWTPNLPEARAGDVLPCYISFEAGPKKWTTREFSLKIGGSGRHMRCDKCFTVGMAPKATLAASTGARMAALSGGANSTAGRGSLERGATARRDALEHGRDGEAAAPGPTARVQDLLDAADLQGTSVELEDDILIYEPGTPPGERVMGRLQAGMSVRVDGAAGSGHARVQFTTSSGRTYAGTAKVADLVPRHPLGVALAAAGTGAAASPAAEQELVVDLLPYALVKPGTALVTMKLRIAGKDGKVLERTPTTVSSSPDGYRDVRWALAAAELRPGESYLCHFVHRGGERVWTSQAFGLACEENEAGAWGTWEAEPPRLRFRLLPQPEADAMLEQAVARKRAAAETAAAGTGTPGAAGFRTGKAVLARATAIYSLADLPGARAMGTLPAGATVYVMEDLGGEFARVRFTTPRGRSVEGVAKKADLRGAGP